MARDPERLRPAVHEALARNRYAAVATASAEQPHVVLMAFAALAQGRELVLATDRRTRKYANLMANPRVAVLVDHQQPQRLRAPRRLGITAIGVAETVSGAEVVGASNAYLERNPDLHAFTAEPDCVFVRIRVEGYQVATGIHEAQWCPARCLVGDPEPSG